jgi:hypothetical protein
MAEQQRREFDPSTTGVASGPGDTKPDTAVGIPTSTPAAGTYSTPLPDGLTPEQAARDEAIREGWEGIGGVGGPEGRGNREEFR